MGTYKEKYLIRNSEKLEFITFNEFKITNTFFKMIKINSDCLHEVWIGNWIY
jgi:hypothetical protein